MSCAVYKCKTRHVKGSYISFFRFPYKKELAEKWVEACGNPNPSKIKASSRRVCSLHFCISDFNTSCGQARSLKDNVVPTKNLNCQKLGDGFEIGTASSSTSTSSQGSSDNNNLNSTSTVYTNLSDETLHSQIELMRREINDFKKQKAKSDKIIDGIKSIFSEKQIFKLSNGNKRVKWEIEDISSGIVLYAAGARAYRCLLKRKFPLPAISTLQEWSRKIVFNPGIMNNVLNVMNKIDMTPYEKVCVVSFDEMKLKTKKDESLKSFNYAQVVMARGLFANWKQPIYFDFDCKPTRMIMDEIITALEMNGFHVVAMVSDFGPTSENLLNEYNVSVEKSWFSNPVDPDCKIYLFADVPHLLLSLRNNFLLLGFDIGGKHIQGNVFIELLENISHPELNTVPKLTPEMLSVGGPTKHKIKSAANVFSHTVSQAITTLGNFRAIQSENWLECASFIHSVSEWFNCLNYREPQYDSKEQLAAYGLSINSQNEIVDQMSAAIQTMRVHGYSEPFQFQKDILMTNNSLKLLYWDMQKKYQAEYLLTHRLNQDIVKNFFKHLRARGIPDEMEFKLRMQSYVLGMKDDLSSLNTVDATNNDFNTTKTLSRSLFSSIYEKDETTPYEITNDLLEELGFYEDNQIIPNY